MFNPPEVVYLTELTSVCEDAAMSLGLTDAIPVAQASFLGEWMAAQFAPYGVGVALHCGHSVSAGYRLAAINVRHALSRV